MKDNKALLTDYLVHVQLCKMNINNLLDKPFCSLTGQNLSIKFCKSLIMGSRSFQKDTVSLCSSKGCKVVACQTLKMI